MKDLLITHTDLDGISPIILMNLTKRKFDFKSIDINEIESTFIDLFKTDLKVYEHIYIVDLTIPETIYETLKKLNNVLVFDHHETHLYANKFDFVTVKIKEFDRPTCGTELFYNYIKKIYKNLDTPIIRDYVDLVRQIDTWDFTDIEMAKNIGSLPIIYGKKEYIKLLSKRLIKNKEKFELTAFEKRYLKIKKEEEKNFIENKNKQLMKYEIAGRKCGIVFAGNCNKSELGNVLATNNPDIDLIIIIDTTKAVSYRTTRDDVECNKFAELFGGGGHQKASGSGFTDEMREEIIKNYFKDVKRLEDNKN